MYYTVYKITNLVNNKIYIGVHKTKDLDDTYMGSGTILKRAITKHGIENFKKEYLEIFNNAEDMFNMEANLVNEEFVKEANNYNIKLGGYGGFDFVNSNINYEDKLKAAMATKKYFEENPDAAQRKREQLKNSSTFETCSLGGRNSPGFANKSHSDETKKKMSEARKGKVSGKNNPSYGSIWIYSLLEKLSKKIPKEDFLNYEANGWLLGRKMKF